MQLPFEMLWFVAEFGQEKNQWVVTIRRGSHNKNVSKFTYPLYKVIPTNLELSF